MSHLEYEVFGIGPEDYLEMFPDMDEVRRQFDEMAADGWRLVSTWGSGRDNRVLMSAWERVAAADQPPRRKLGFKFVLSEGPGAKE